MSPRAITPFLRGKTWWARVPRVSGFAVQRSLGTSDKRTAVEECRFLAWLRGRRESWLLEQLASGKTPVGDAYDAYTQNRLPEFITQLRDGITDVDIEPYVTQWQSDLERRKKPNLGGRSKYLRQVRTLIPAGQPFRRSEFTKGRIVAWLQAIKVGQPNRYRAALSSFAEYLLMVDVLATNPVRQIPMAEESNARTLHLSVADAAALVSVLESPYNALHALMLCTGMEVSAALSVKRRDVNLDALTVYARGTKTVTRERTCHVYDTWAPLFAVVRRHLAGLTPDAPLFPGVDVWSSLAALRRGLKAKHLPLEYRQHDHRHTWAVQALRDGIEAHAVAAQLGHANALMLRTVYGKYVPKASDFRRSATGTATPALKEDAK